MNTSSPLLTKLSSQRVGYTAVRHIPPVEKFACSAFKIAWQRAMSDFSGRMWLAANSTRSLPVPLLARFTRRMNGGDELSSCHAYSV